jgi:xanthine dehydrogenase iron-sulfur cluster and FAD-binding subunit A
MERMAMIYKFQCKATGDVLMTAPAGERVLRAMGIEPAHQGIVEPGAMPAAIRALETAIEGDEAARARTETASDSMDDDGAPVADDDVSLRQRAWPLVEMMKRAQAAGVPIAWGV